MKNRNLIRDAMMFAVKDITGRVLREATVQSMVDDFEKKLALNGVVFNEAVSFTDHSDELRCSEVELCDCKNHSIKTNYGFEICTVCKNEFDD